MSVLLTCYAMKSLCFNILFYGEIRNFNIVVKRIRTGTWFDFGRDVFPPFTLVSTETISLRVCCVSVYHNGGTNVLYETGLFLDILHHL